MFHTVHGCTLILTHSLQIECIMDGSTGIVERKHWNGLDTRVGASGPLGLIAFNTLASSQLH